MIHENGKIVDIAVIGAGPGGMACAIEAKLAGIDNIMVIDKAPHHNDMIHKFYKKGKRVQCGYYIKDFLSNHLQKNHQHKTDGAHLRKKPGFQR